MSRKEEQKRLENLSSTKRKSRLGSRAGSVSERPPWRSGSVKDGPSRAYSRTSTFIDEHGERIDSNMIKEQNAKVKARKNRRASKFDLSGIPMP